MKALQFEDMGVRSALQVDGVAPSRHAFSGARERQTYKSGPRLRVPMARGATPSTSALQTHLIVSSSKPRTISCTNNGASA